MDLLRSRGVNADLPPEFEALAAQASGTPEGEYFTVTLTHAQMGTLLAVLGAAPYSQVVELVEAIRFQTEDQWNRAAQTQVLASIPTDGQVPS